MGTVLEFSKQVLSELEPGLPELRPVEDSDRREQMAGRHICALCSSTGRKRQMLPCLCFPQAGLNLLFTVT